MTEEIKKKGVFRRVLIPVLAFFVLCLGVLIYIDEEQNLAPINIVSNEIQKPKVSYLSVSPSTYSTEIEFIGMVTSRSDVVIKSFVDGQFEWVDEGLLPGAHVKQGQVIARVKDHIYQAHVANAENRLANANLSLATAQNQERFSREAWALSGNEEPISPLASRELETQSAKAELDAAKKELEEAKARLQDTKIRAPITGVIVERYAMPGAQVFAGDELYRVQDDLQLDIVGEIPPQSLGLVSSIEEIIEAYLLANDAGKEWKLRVRSIAPFLSDNTKQQRVYFEYFGTGNPSEDPKIGGAYKVRMRGREMPDLIRIPTQSITQDGIIWVIDKDDRLNEITVSKIFNKGGHTYVRSLLNDDFIRIAATPLVSFVPGRKVEPVEVTQVDQMAGVK